MQEIPASQLARYRAGTFRLPPSLPLATPQQALDWVNERGFVYFWPIKGAVMPSLWAAVAGDRPVADAHDDPGHTTWGWKDSALGTKQWYYAKILRRKATMISVVVAPFFYALSENYGSPEEDYLIAYREGRLTLAAKQVYEALLDNGAMNTIDLRREAKLASKGSDSEFNRALEQLQSDFKILPIGVAEAGAWRYSFIYDITARYWPEIPARARDITEAMARETLLGLYFASVGAARLADAVRLFGWGLPVTARVVKRLETEGRLQGGLRLEGQAGEWLATSELLAV